MRTKNEILTQVSNLAIESPRSGIIPDLADVLMIEVMIDTRDIFDNIHIDLMKLVLLAKAKQQNAQKPA